MEIRLYLQILKRGWWIIALTMLAALNTALLVSYLTPPVYRAASRFIVSPNAAAYANSSDVNSSMDTLDRRSIINTYKELLASPSVYGTHPVIQKIPMVEFQKEYSVKAVVIPDTNILQLTVDGADPIAVTNIAKAIETQSISYINKMYPVYNFAILDSATVPTEPVLPQPVQNVGLALLIGLFFGIGLAFLRDQFQNTLDSLRFRSVIDHTTTAFTRSHFEKSLVDEISNNPEGVLSFGIINFSGLDEVIDVLPQAIAQRILRQITQTLKDELRSHDIVGRWGKNQLSILLPSTPGNAAENTLKRIQKLLAAPINLEEINNMVIHPDPCIGISEKNQGETNSTTLIQQAEKAMSKAQTVENASVVLFAKMESAGSPVD